MDDVPPPLPVKQRSKSMLSDQNSIPHDDGVFGTVSSQQRHTVGFCTVPSSQRHTVGSDTVPLSQRHAVCLPSADFMASLDNVLAELNEASAPKKPPLTTRLSSYDNVTPSSSSATVNGKCFSFPTSSVTPNLSTTTWHSSSDEPSNSFVSQNHAGSSDGSLSEYFVLSGHDALHAEGYPVSQTSHRVRSMIASSGPVEPATTAAPPLPMKLKHSQSPLCFVSVLCSLVLLLLLLHPFNGLFSGTTWVSQYQKGKTSLNLNEARDVGCLGCSGISWTVCKQSAPHSRQITTSTAYRSIFNGPNALPDTQPTVSKH